MYQVVEVFCGGSVAEGSKTNTCIAHLDTRTHSRRKQYVIGTIPSETLHFSVCATSLKCEIFRIARVNPFQNCKCTPLTVNAR